ncbi:MAG: hypothetical protein NZ889_02760 [Candidatus Pacearchaeota archaeon]|nr:hypothetical protein [Candidatus Pacearchaeota archaeon]
MTKKNLVGAWAFTVGVILAVIFGLFAGFTWVPWVLVIIGIIVGLLNITDVETQPFMIAGAILVIVSYFGGSVFDQIFFLGDILDNLLMIFVPATVIVALKSLFEIAKK